MLKRTLYFENPCRLSLKLQQLVVEFTADDREPVTVPAEDIGMVIVDHPTITITPPLIEQLVLQNAAVIFCSSKHMPQSMLLSLDGNTLQNEVFRNQAAASKPLLKNLWKQTVEAKITNQAAMLKGRGGDHRYLTRLAAEVLSDDTSNREAVAAKFYWDKLFYPSFSRERYGDYPNALLNYGYAILRATIARALVGSGLLPTLGIHHHNKYNAYCLADDIMEPYRPFVDKLVAELFDQNPDALQMSREHKRALLQIPVLDVQFDDFTRPLMVGASVTTASLARCFAGEQRKIAYPRFV